MSESGVKKELLGNAKKTVVVDDKNFKERIDRILKSLEAGEDTQGFEKQLIGNFFALNSENKVGYFRKFDESIRMKILTENASRFKPEEFDKFLECISHTQVFKMFKLASRGFVEGGKDYATMSEDEKKEYTKKEYKYWLKHSPAERAVLYPILRHKPNKARYFGRVAAHTVLESLLYLPEVLWRGAGKFFPVVGSWSFPVFEGAGSYGGEVRKRFANFSDVKTLRRLGKVPDVQGADETVKSFYGQAEANYIMNEFWKLTKSDRLRKETDLNKLAVLFRLMSAEEQVKYFNLLTNRNVQFFLLGKKTVMKDEAVKQCLSLVKGYEATPSTALEDFEKSNVTSSSRNDNAVQAGKKLFDLYTIHKSSTGKENNEKVSMPKASWEIAKGVLKIVGALVVVAFCVSWLTALPIALAAIGVVGITAKLIGFGVAAGISAGLLAGLSDRKNIDKWNPVYNFKKARKINEFNRIEKGQENLVAVVDNFRAGEFEPFSDQKYRESVEKHRVRTPEKDSNDLSIPRTERPEPYQDWGDGVGEFIGE